MSARLGEPIVGTAAHARVWLGIEWTDTWAAKAVENAEFPAPVRARLQQWDKEIDRLRPQLIRRPGRAAKTSKVVIGLPELGRTVELDLPEIDALAEVDLPEIARGWLPADATVLDRPVMLVCTHGKRDRCCAKKGTPVWERIAACDDVITWQTTHLGGHRFAATLVWLPHGICYGRLCAEEVDAVLDAVRCGEVFRLDRYRGRSVDAGPGQAAETFVREHTKLRRVDEVGVEVTWQDGDRWEARVYAGDARFAVTVAYAESDVLSKASCDKPLVPFGGYELVELRAL
jgi:hypothetical protein